MKKINFTLMAFFILLTVLQQPVFAQVKIGANPTTINANSLLEMEQNTSTGRYGMRLPRVALDSTSSFAPLSAHVQGMTVYNTATAGTGFTAVSPGIYYNDGTKWIRASKESGVASGYVYHLTNSGGTRGVNSSTSVIFGLTKTYTSNDGSDYNPTDGTWTCPSSGVYRFLYQEQLLENQWGNGNYNTLYITIYKNGVQIEGHSPTSFLAPSQPSYNRGSGSIEVISYCNAGDVITVTYTFNAGLGAYIYSPYPSFTITEITGNGVTSSSSGPNQVPAAQNVSITGNTLLGQTLSSSFTYSDYEGNPQNGTTRQWYRADDASGTNETAISGATAATYTLSYADQGKYIRVGITPASSVGATPGAQVYSSYVYNFPCGDPAGTVTFTYNGASVTYGTILSTTGPGRCYLDRNLGAPGVATSTSDATNFGHYFQWGRPDDGHQVPSSTTTGVLAISDIPGHGAFITNTAAPYDWRDNNNNLRWAIDKQGPCPGGWHVPTSAEWTAESSWITNIWNAYTYLKLPGAGYRGSTGGMGLNGMGYYWSSTPSGTNSCNFAFNTSASYPCNGYYRAEAYPIRCIKD